MKSNNNTEIIWKYISGKIIKSIAICLARIEERYYDEKKLIILIGKKISEKKFLNNGTINKF